MEGPKLSKRHIATCVSKPHNCKIFNFEVSAFLYSKQHNSSISGHKNEQILARNTFFHAFSVLMLFLTWTKSSLNSEMHQFSFSLLFLQWNQNNITEKNSIIFPLKWPKSPKIPHPYASQHSHYVPNTPGKHPQSYGFFSAMNNAVKQFFVSPVKFRFS